MSKITSLSFAACFLLGSLGLAMAAGEGGGSSGGGSSGGGTSGGGASGGGSAGGGNNTSVKKTCKKGQVVKMMKKNGKNVKTCVKASAGVLPDDELYSQGRELAKAGEYDWALDVLAAIENQNQPRVLNYIGYSHRKAGRLETGITYYRKALAIDPNYVLAREYLGEGYVAAGKIELAQAELNEIAKRCGVTCEEYKDLSAAIGTATQ
jgi:tetratricopeptide (TPR) repeat protein